MRPAAATQPRATLLRRLSPRAERFAFGIPARVRPQGHATWRDADLVNISRTGLLLAVGGAAFPPAESIDVEFTPVAGVEQLVEVRCVGYIVRETTDADGRALIAATIEQYL